MLRSSLLLAALPLCHAAQADSIAPWTRLGGVPGGDVGCFVFDATHPGVTFAGSSGGFIFRSTDGGLHWRRTAVGRATEEFRAITQSPAAPDTFFAFSTGQTATALGSGRVYASTDDGVTWALLPHQPTTSSGLQGWGRGIAIDPTGQIIVLSDHLAGILRSTDGGQSWTNPLPRSVARPYGLADDAGHPGTLYLAGYTLSPQQTAAIWKSTDFGATWVQSTPPALNKGDYPFAASVAVQPGRDAILATYGYYDSAFNELGGVARSLNGGVSWTQFGTGLLADFNPGSASGGIAFDAARPGFVYLTDNALSGLGDGGGFYRSGDNGGHWSAIGNRHPFGGGFVAATRPAVPGYPAALFVGDPGVTISTDNGSHWTSHPFGNAPLKAVADGGKPGLLVGLTQTNVVFSQTGGKFWALAGNWRGSHATLALAVDLGQATPAIFVATSDNLWRSTDHAHWVSVRPASLPAGATIGSLVTAPDGRLYATAGGNLVYRSADSGSSWTSATIGTASDNFNGTTPLALTNAPAGSPEAGRVYASLTSGLWLSNDDGTTWSRNAAQPDPQSGAFADMTVQHVSPYGLIVSTYELGGLTVSTDGGASFTRIDGLPALSLPILTAAPMSKQVYAEYGTSEVLESVDNFSTSNNIAVQLFPYDSQAGGGGSISAAGSGLFVSDQSGATFTAPYSSP